MVMGAGVFVEPGQACQEEHSPYMADNREHTIEAMCNAVPGVYGQDEALLC